MKKLLPFLVLSLIISSSHAQIKNPNIEAMVATERAFAKLARDQNTRDAFLYYMSDSVITAGPNGPIKGKEEIKKQKIGNSWLYWDVTYADVNNTGDFGYTTGPWEFRANKTDKEPVAFGEFNSIWKKQGDGSWKNICDIGVSHQKSVAVDSVQFSEGDGRGFSYVVHDADNSKFSDKNFNRQLIRNASEAYSKNLASNSRIIHSGKPPAVHQEQRSAFLTNIEKITSATCIGGYMPKSGDLGFTYGKISVEVTEKEKKLIKTGTYLRVWKTYKMGYELVLDVLSY